MKNNNFHKLMAVQGFLMATAGIMMTRRLAIEMMRTAGFKTADSIAALVAGSVLAILFIALFVLGVGFTIIALRIIHGKTDIDKCDDEPEVTTNNTLIGMHRDLCEDVTRTNLQEIEDYRASVAKEKEKR